MEVIEEPFGDDVREIALTRAPLVKVIAQVTFPLIASISKQAFIAEFQERLRARYPVAKKEMQTGIQITSEGVQTQDGSVTWRFKNRADTQQVSLGPNFVALDTDRYTSRTEFFNDFKAAVSALAETIRPATFDRLGVRYVDRIEGPSALPLERFLRPEVLGHSRTRLGGDADIQHAITDTIFRVGLAQLHARWGQLPGNATLDPFVPASTVESWLLDLDMFSDNPGQEFDTASIVDMATGFASRIYRFFRWSVTKDFLDHFGAEQ